MRVPGYIKSKVNADDCEELLCEFATRIPKYLTPVRTKLFLSAFAVILFIPISICGMHKLIKNVAFGNENGAKFMNLPLTVTDSKRSVITVPSGTIKANPFLPYRDIDGTASLDVPVYNLIEPPETVDENSDGARVMDTIVSGILYDKYSPSAILNIEGNDYLVKKGDIVNNYKVINIMQDSVTVKLGSNTYKAGIGEILTEGDVTHNDVSNLNKKFGGEGR